MVELPTLYDHQAEHKDRVRASLANNRAVILCANPGVGKTRMSKWVLASAVNREATAQQSGNMLFAVHRRGLVDNAAVSFDEEPSLPHGVIMSGREHSVENRVQVASIDTLLSWFCEGGTYSWSVTFDLVVFDECHSHHSKLAKFLRCHNAKRAELRLHEPYVIGLSATPEAQGLSDVYKDIVSGPTTEWLTAQMYLSPFRYFRATQGQLGKLVRRGGEFTKDSVSLAMEGLAGDLVRDWKQFAEGRATVGFFPRRVHAREAQETLVAAGVDAEYVDGETPDDRRRQIYDHLNHGRIDYLCNVGVVERGTDIPRIGCVQVCTAVASRVRWRQMIGRGARIHPEVPDCLVLDHGGNLKRNLGFFEDEIDWTLDISTKASKDQEARLTIECPQCQAIYRGGRCRSCGYEPTPRERKSQGLEFDGTELSEVKPSKKERQAKTNEQIMVSALYACGRSGRTWKQALAIAYGKAKQQGTQFKVPKSVTVSSREYRMLPHGSPDENRRVRQLYPFTVGM